MGNKIWIAGEGFEIDTRVVRWDEGPQFNAHLNQCINPSHACPSGVYPFSTKKPVRRTHRFSHRPQLRSFKGGMPPLKAVQNVTRQFILHHDGCDSAKTCFNVLHNERGLSCHFLVDNDGTIYQTLDLAFMAWHAAGFNASSVGVELCNRGDAIKWPTFYSKKGQEREKATCQIHEHVYLAFDYTKAQYEAMRSLVRGLARALPNMPIDYPQESPGRQAWKEISGAKTYAGLLGHYHTTRRKWDPGPFDFKEFCESIRGRLSFPVSMRGEEPGVPDDDTERAEDVEKLYGQNEQKDGGYYPVGPYGEMRLWHGGVHIAGKRGTKIHAPFPGRIVAVRTGRPMSAVGSTNMVLMRHDIRIGVEAVRFFSLFFHVADEWDKSGEDAPGWLTSAGWLANKRKVQTVLLDEPVEAGDVIGHIDVAGPSDNRQSQFHLEMFASEEISAKLGVKFNLIDGAASGRFAPDSVIKAIDEDKDGKLSRRELLTYFTSNDRRVARLFTTYHVAEWTSTPDWTSELTRLPELRDKKKREIEEIVTEQIEPTLWWDKDVAKHARLPVEGLVFHYNPVTLIKVINDELQKAKILGSNGKNAFDVSKAKVKPDDILGDIDDEDGDSFVTEAELLDEEDTGKDLTLEDLANGFPE